MSDFWAGFEKRATEFKRFTDYFKSKNRGTAHLENTDRGDRNEDMTGAFSYG